MPVIEVIGSYRMRYEPLDSSGALGSTIRLAWTDALGESVSLVDLDFNREGCIVSAEDMVDADVIDSDSHFVDCFHIAFKWNDGDNSVAYWYPQGITGSYDAVGGHGLWGSSSRHPTDGDESEPPDGKKLLLASWYCRSEAEYGVGDGLADPKGIRVSVVDVTEWDDPVRYRHILLVRPFMDDGVLDFEEVTYQDSKYGKTSYHAGGIAWYGRYLYVAGGSRLLVFDLRRVKEVEGSDDDLCGLHGGVYHARGYRYVCPLVAEYVVEEEDGAYFSNVAIDRSTTPHRLLGGRYLYDEDDLSDSLVTWWELSESSGLLQGAESGSAPFASFHLNTYVDSVVGVITEERGAQGVLSLGDDFWISGEDRLLYQNLRSGSSQEYKWPHGCEDLTYSARSDNLWCLTEFIEREPGDLPRRFVFAVKLADFDG
ncbi:MAG: hypothetical protein FJ102_09345 [Deltaproteobacteria bacterium]|nr:hypothetical protein [Deltaproteobacteria bacterium]